MRSVTSRHGTAGQGPEAKAALVVMMDNVTLDETSYMTRPPAPQVGDPLHYDTFIQRLCQDYSERFGS